MAGILKAVTNETSCRLGRLREWEPRVVAWEGRASAGPLEGMCGNDGKSHCEDEKGDFQALDLS
jgi:hypothetical protein